MFLKFLSIYVDRNVFGLSYKMYVRPHLDYGDVIVHNQRMDLMDLVERVQYKAALIVSGCWQGTSREKLYDGLGWESLSRRLTIFYKIHNGLTPSYLSDRIPRRNVIDIYLRNGNENLPLIRKERYETVYFLILFFFYLFFFYLFFLLFFFFYYYTYTIKSCKNLDNEVKSKPSVQSFKIYLNNYIRPLDHPLRNT